MATTTFHEYDGDGSNKDFTYSFPTYFVTEVKVQVDGVEVNNYTVLSYTTSGTKTVRFDNTTGSVNSTVCETSGAPKSTLKVRVYRDTTIDAAKHTYQVGASVKAGDLNTNQEQVLRALQEQQFNTETTPDYRDNSITGAKIKNDAIDSQHYAADSIDTEHYAPLSVDTAALAGDAVNGDKIANLSIDSEHYVVGSIDTAHLSNDAINTDKLADDSVETDRIKNLAVTEEKLGNESVTSAKIKNATITAADIANDTITGTQIATGTITNAHLDNVTITGAKIATDAITTGKILDGTIVNADINASAAIAGTKISPNFGSQVIQTTGNITVGGTVDSRDVNADGTKLDTIETSATADQTASEIRSLVEAASDSNVFTDTDHSKLNAIEDSATADQTASEIKTLYESNSNTNPLTDAEKAVIDGVTATTSELNILDGVTANKDELNLLDGKSIVTTIAANATDVQLPSAQAVNERIVSVMQDSGGFVPIANKDSFPETNPDPNDDAGTIISIADAGGLVVNGSGVSTTGDTITTDATVTINGIDSSLHSSTIATGKGMLVETTSTLNTYTYHRLVVDEAGVSNAQTLVNDFNERYRVSDNAPSSSLDNGDLWFNTSSGNEAMKVYNSTASAWEEITSTGNYDILELKDTDGSSPTLDGSVKDFKLVTKGTSSAVTPNHAAQLIVSINGVIQEPNTGTSTPTNGFAISGSTIKFSNNLPASDVFIARIGASVDIGTPSNNTVTSAHIVDGSIANVDVSTSAAIAGTKIAPDFGSQNIDTTGHILLDSDSSQLKIGDGEDLKIFHNGTRSKIENLTGDLRICGNDIKLKNYDDDETYITCADNGAVELYHNNVKRLETVSDGVNIIGNAGLTITGIQDNTADLFFHADGGDDNADKWYVGAYADGTFHILNLASGSWEESIKATGNGNVELYYDNSKKFETISSGVSLANGADATTSKLLLSLGNASSKEATIQGISSSTNEKGIEFKTYSFAAKTPLTLTHDGHLNVPDSSKIQLGGNQDLQIYHNGGNGQSYIDHTGTLNLRSTGNIEILKNGGDEPMAKFTPDGAVSLYYDNSKKLETTSSGVNIPAELTVNSLVVDDDGSGSPLVLIKGDDNNPWGLQVRNDTYSTGANDGWKIYQENDGTIVDFHHGNGAYEVRSFRTKDASTTNTVMEFTANRGVDLYYENSKKAATDTGGFKIWSGNLLLDRDDALIKFGASNDLVIYHSSGSNNIIECGNGMELHINKGDTENMAKFIPDGAVELYYNNTKTFETNDNGVKVLGSEGSGGQLQIYADEGDDNQDKWMVEATTGGELHFKSYTSGSWEDCLHLTGNGQVELFYDNSKKLETASTGVLMPVTGADASTALQLNGTNGSSETQSLIIDSDGENGRADFKFNVGNGTPDLNMRFTANATELYYDNAKKLETLSNGVKIYGNLELLDSGADVRIKNDNGKCVWGANDDMYIYHNSSEDQNYIYSDNKNLHVCANGANIEVRPVNAEISARFLPNSAAELYHNGSKKLETTSSGITVTGSCSGCDFNFSNMNPANTPANEVDGTRGSWTLQEGADDLFLINRNNGKKYKFNLTEVS